MMPETFRKSSKLKSIHTSGTRVCVRLCLPSKPSKALSVEQEICPHAVPSTGVEDAMLSLVARNQRYSNLVRQERGSQRFATICRWSLGSSANRVTYTFCFRCDYTTDITYLASYSRTFGVYCSEILYSTRKALIALKFVTLFSKCSILLSHGGSLQGITVMKYQRSHSTLTYKRSELEALVNT